MKTLVTGAAGFIGSAVTKCLLARGRQVRVLLEPGYTPRLDLLQGLPVERVTGDVLDREAVARALAGCDTLYHLAALYALWSPHPERIYEVNVEGTKTVLWAAYKAGLRRVVYTSSIAAIGRRDGAPADETCLFGPRDWADGNAYIRSKWLAEREALRFAQEGLDLVVVNPAFPFGAGDVGPTPTGSYILEALRGRMPGYFPGGFCVIDVEDCAEGHVLAEERGRKGERYILGNHNVSYYEFYTLLAEVAGIRMPRWRLPLMLLAPWGYLMELWADHVTHRPPRGTYKAARQVSRNLFFDNTKARTELGLPVTPLRDTLEKAVRWFRDHGYVR
ncbi:MAG: SDR family oxidoreductase [Myxococcales bacterium]|nr:SDR family oxidoreductase [Myxococcota bacterium]MDW8282144.1 SDR family oxidoreductase [Myxococcales bacterium]